VNPLPSGRGSSKTTNTVYPPRIAKINHVQNKPIAIVKYE